MLCSFSMEYMHVLSPFANGELNNHPNELNDSQLFQQNLTASVSGAGARGGFAYPGHSLSSLE
jgi:hypothetical protein